VDDDLPLGRATVLASPRAQQPRRDSGSASALVGKRQRVDRRRDRERGTGARGSHRVFELAARGEAQELVGVDRYDDVGAGGEQARGVRVAQSRGPELEGLLADAVDRQPFGDQRVDDRGGRVVGAVVDDGDRVEGAQVVADRRLEDVLLVADDREADEPHADQRPAKSRQDANAR
jgi:hypothetical protein